MKIAWLVDSTASLPDDLKNHDDVYVVPMEIISGVNTYRDTIDLTNDEFYSLMKNKNDFLKTSQPTFQSFLDTYESINSKDYDAVISLHISSHLSGTFSSSVQATQLISFANKKVFVIDTEIGAYPLSILVKKGMEKQSFFNSVEKLVSFLKEECKKAKLFVLVTSLEQLKRSGRLTSSQFLFGSLLNIHLVLHTKQGKLEVFDKVRSFKKSKQVIVNVLKEDLEHSTFNKLYIMEGNCMEEAVKFKEEILALFPHLNISIVPLSTSISVHAGEGSMAISWFTPF